jgi:hypothetical protein
VSVPSRFLFRANEPEGSALELKPNRHFSI